MVFEFTNAVFKALKNLFWYLLSYLKFHPKTGSSDDALQGGQTDPSSPGIPVPIKPPPFFALLIGINDYPNVPALQGAVADAKAVQDFLETVLRVPRAQIRTLYNAEATRDAIIKGLRTFRGDMRIRRGDPILVYFAGHGTTDDAPQGWVTGEKKIQLMVPYDYGEERGKDTINAIPDRTIGHLLSELADVKGDNITVIFDCCHSGSGTRTNEVEPTRLARGITSRVKVPAGLDRDIWIAPLEERAAEIPTGFLYAGLRSHVLLAACSANESALEEHERGIFTTALLETLSLVGADKVTYAELMERIPDLPGQSPQCEGVNQKNILFNARAPSQGRVVYPVRKEGNQLVMKAGAAHGITEKAEFAVYGGRSWATHTSEPLGTFEVGIIRPFKTDLVVVGDTLANVEIPDQAFALQTRAGVEENLRLHVTSKLVELFEQVAQDMRERAPSQGGIRLVKESETADIKVALENDLMVFEHLDSLTTIHGLRRMPFALNPNPEDVYPIIRAATHFFWHLRHSPKRRTLRSRVTMEFTEVKQDMDDIDDDLWPILKPITDNLISGNVVDFVVNPNSVYGMKVTSVTSIPMYASLFYFDCSSFSIACYYHNLTVGGAKIDPSLPPYGELSIGYGGGGAVPYRYYLREGQDVDVGFLKLYLSTEPVDLSDVAQISPFGGGRTPEVHARGIPKPVWDTLLIPIVQRKALPS